MTGNTEKVNCTSNGYGYVKFKSVDEAQKAVDQLNSADLNGQKILVERFDKDKKMNTQTNIYVKDFPSSWTEQNLREYFKEFGEMGSVVIMKDSEGRSFGFVCFSTPD